MLGSDQPNVFGEDLNVKSVYMKDSKVNTIYHMNLQVK
jgi:hypothetical protein